jgi:hypothetical protein
MVTRVQRGDMVERDGVEMMVEGVDVVGLEPHVLCVWPVFDNGDQPLYRRAFPTSEVRAVKVPQMDRQTFMARLDASVSTRPPEPSDMLAMRSHTLTGNKFDPRPVRAISDHLLDAMERGDGWTPQQVRDVIADYRKCTRSKG